MDQKQEITERLKQSNNILVTVSANPSVDQLASCIALTLALNKMGKHSTAVFSGAIPSTIEFLQPEKTIEKTTDSLRDFIIALDKAKADKLRYKVEDKIVKIFITPYKTSITDKDLEFSQGDFNVDAVIALGIHVQADVDQAITAHGRILHDATVISVNTQAGEELGSINWVDAKASSLSELVSLLINTLDKSLMDGQIATALLTGIVAETDRFSNEKTTPATMSMSAELMGAGANQQLVVSKLKVAETPPPVPEAPAEAPASDQPKDIEHAQPIKLRTTEPTAPPKEEDGALEISHLDGDKPLLEGIDASTDVTAGPDQLKEPTTPQINIDDQGSLHNLAYEAVDAIDAKQAETADKPAASIDPTGHMQTQHMVLQPPTMGGQLTANTVPEDGTPARDPLSLPSPEENPLLQRSPFAPPASATTAGDSGVFGGPDPEELPSGSPMPSPSVFGPSQPDPSPAAAAPPAQQPLVPPSATPPGQHTMLPPQPVQQPAADAPAPAHLDSARDAVMQAIGSQPPAQQQPIQALNAQPLGDPLRTPNPGPTLPPVPGSPAGPPPPPVPPPMMPPMPPAQQ